MDIDAAVGTGRARDAAGCVTSWSSSVALLLLLCGIGWLVLAVAPPLGQIPDSAVEMMIYPAVYPKSRDKFIFFAMIILGLIAVLLVAHGHVRATRRSMDDRVVFLACGLAALGLGGWLADDGLISVLSVHSRALGGGAVISLAMISLAIACLGALRSAALARVVSAVSFVLPVAVAAWLAYATRVISADHVIYDPVYTSHFEALASSIYQAATGATCLVDFKAQYGCYAEFIAPLVRLAGSSIRNLSLILTSLLMVAIVLILWALRSWIRSTPVFFAAAVCVVALFNINALLGSGDPYFQYHPVRSLFPAISLVGVMALQRWPHRGADIAGGFMAGAAACWNMDTGVVVAVALAGFIVISRIDGTLPWRHCFRAPLVGFLAFAAGLGGGVLAFWLGLALKSGALPQLSNAIEYQQVFYMSGFAMFPTPGFPAVWGMSVIVLALGGLAVASHTLAGKSMRREDGVLLYLLLLSLGLMVYYQGRSHWVVYLLVAWPLVIAFFVLADRAIQSLRSAAASIALTAVLVCGPLLGVLVNLPRVAGLTAALAAPVAATEMTEDIAFVRGMTTPGERVAIVAENQTTLYASSQTVPGLSGPSLAEIVTVAQLAELNGRIHHGPAKLFANSGKQPTIILQRRMLDLTDYQLAAVGPMGRLSLYVRKPPASR